MQPLNILDILNLSPTAKVGRTINTIINKTPKLTHTLTGTPTWGCEPIEAYQNNKKAWLSDDGNLVQGIYVNMPDNEYHAIKKCVSSTALKAAAYDPEEGENKYLGNQKVKEPSVILERAYAAGHLIHGKILEPWLDDYNVETTRTIAELQLFGHNVIENHTQLKEFLAKHDVKIGQKTIQLKVDLAKEVDTNILYMPHYLDSVKGNSKKRYLCREDYDKCIDVVTKFKGSHLYTHNYKHRGYSELTIIAYDDANEIWVKARIDRIDHKNRMLDIKTIHTLSQQQIQRDIDDRLYCLQGAFYHRVARLAGLVLEDLFALTFIEWDEKQRFTRVEITDRGWQISKEFENDVYLDFIDWIRTSENKDSLNYSGVIHIEPSTYRLSRRVRVNS